MLVCAAAADADYDLSAFASSADYIGAIMSRPNENSRRQSAAGLRALLFLLEKAGVDPAPLVLAREKSGRPYFAGSDLKFGISHSGSLAVCALSDSDVGIDIERVRDVRNAAALAERHFSPSELAWAGEMTAEKFFTVWTKKRRCSSATAAAWTATCAPWTRRRKISASTCCATAEISI